jgi:hypothetical protein
MKSKEFIKDAIAPIGKIGADTAPPATATAAPQGTSALDQEVGQAVAQPPGLIKQGINKLTAPINDPAATQNTQSKVGSAIARTVGGVANAATAGLGVAGDAIKLGQQTSMTGSAGSNTLGTQAAANRAGSGSKPSAVNPNNPDPELIDQLKSAAGNQPLSQSTGNPGIDQLLRNAGLVR